MQVRSQESIREEPVTPTSRCPPLKSADSQLFEGARPPGTDARRNGPTDAERSEAP
jgi:hypothetical protein